MPEGPDRRTFLYALAGTTVAFLGGVEYIVADAAETERLTKELRLDGRPRLPPNQYPLERLRPMGGSEGDPSPKSFRLKVHGEVEKPFELDFAELLRMPQTEETCDVHCVTKWSVLGAKWTGVRVSELAERAQPRANARFVI